MRLILSFLIATFGLGLIDQSDSKILLFEFDEAIHFKYSLDQELPSWNAKTRIFRNSKTNKLRNLLYKNIPATLDDSASIIQDLEESAFKRFTIPSNKIDTLREAFSIKQTDTIALPNRCLPIFRDVLVLKNSGQIVCVIKLCMKCRHTQFIGIESADTQYFGQHDEWNILKNVLKYEREPNLWESLHDGPFGNE